MLKVCASPWTNCNTGLLRPGRAVEEKLLASTRLYSAGLNITLTSVPALLPLRKVIVARTKGLIGFPLAPAKPLALDAQALLDALHHLVTDPLDVDPRGRWGDGGRRHRCWRW